MKNKSTLAIILCIYAGIISASISAAAFVISDKVEDFRNGKF